jgi:hypothetical protein
MKQLILSLFLLTCLVACAQDLHRPVQIGQTARNQKVGKGFQIEDTLLSKGVVRFSAIPGSGDVLGVDDSGYVARFAGVGLPDSLALTDGYILTIHYPDTTLSQSLSILNRDNYYFVLKEDLGAGEFTALVYFSDNIINVVSVDSSVSSLSTFSGDIMSNVFTSQQSTRFIYSGDGYSNSISADETGMFLTTDGIGAERPFIRLDEHILLAIEGKPAGINIRQDSDSGSVIISGDAITMPNLSGSGSVVGIDENGLLSRTSGGGGAGIDELYVDNGRLYAVSGTDTLSTNITYLNNPDTTTWRLGNISGEAVPQSSITGDNGQVQIFSLYNNNMQSLGYFQGDIIDFIRFSEFEASRFTMKPDTIFIGTETNAGRVLIGGMYNTEFMGIETNTFDGIVEVSAPITYLVGDGPSGVLRMEITGGSGYLFYSNYGTSDIAFSIMPDEPAVTCYLPFVADQGVTINNETLSIPNIWFVNSTSLDQSEQETDDETGWNDVPSGALYRNASNIIFWKP